MKFKILSFTLKLILIPLTLILISFLLINIVGNNVLEIKTNLDFECYISRTKYSDKNCINNTISYLVYKKFFDINPIINKLTTEKSKYSLTLDDKKEELILKEKASKIEYQISRFGGHMAGLGELIIKRAEECGGDYKIIAAIAGNESGFGKKPYMKYNPFGYLNKKQYTSFEEATYELACQISKQFLVPCENDLNCIVSKYAGTVDDHKQWVNSIHWFVLQF